MPEMKSLTLNDKTYDCFVDSVARTLASATAVIKSASGESITVSDASDVNLYGLRIFGKTTQDGVPTPDAPVDLVSVGDGGNITVNVTGDNDAQSMTIATPNGLPGIPVTSGGNYTDENGQQWVCDEVDLSRGVFVQRVGVYEAKGLKVSNVTPNASGNKWKPYPDICIYDSSLNGTMVNAVYSVLNTKFPMVPLNKEDDEVTGTVMSVYGHGSYLELRFRLMVSEYETAESAVNAINGTVVYYPLKTPIETPLSEEELAAYAELHTYRNNTTVSNNDGAHMELEYVMDAKKYIDSLMGTGGSSARLGSVTIKASAWVTEADGLHSQVVTIAGVTPYSKVDLLPSVEQLAIFHNKDVAFVTENEDGVVTVFAIGDKPTMDYTMQISVTEVVA